MSITHIDITCPQSYAPNQSKIEVIKAIRTISGCGLKEAKDISENDRPQQLFVNTGNVQYLTTEQQDRHFEEQFRILRNNGVKVGETIHIILQELRHLAAKALEQGDDELADEILQLVLAEKLRRKNV
jgi:hypothetical protein